MPNDDGNDDDANVELISDIKKRNPGCFIYTLSVQFHALNPLINSIPNPILAHTHISFFLLYVTFSEKAPHSFHLTNRKFRQKKNPFGLRLQPSTSLPWLFCVSIRKYCFSSSFFHFLLPPLHVLRVPIIHCEKKSKNDKKNMCVDHMSKHAKWP